ncbi:hypothetical protein [Primorskyibacter flagellatus]|uniref:hypothetical protein n=1 Tax=Primorskyibacter flagellatus TaxID=1387277 RepID=UPI003A8F551A
MKHLMFATALTAATISGAAFAQEALENQIETFAPNINYEALSEDARLQIANVINGSGSFSEKQSTVTALALQENAMEEGSMMEDNPYVFYMSDEQYTTFANDLKGFEPSADPANLSNDTRLRLMAAMYGSGSHSDKASLVKSILLDS